MGTIKADTITGLASPNEVSIPNTLANSSEVKVNIADAQVVKVSSTQTDIKVSASRELNILKDSGDDALVLQCSAPDSSNNLRRIECAGEKFSVSTGASSGTTATQKLLIEVDGSIGLGHGSDPTADASVGVSVNTNSANKDQFLPFVNETSGSQQVRADDGIKYNWFTVNNIKKCIKENNLRSKRFVGRGDTKEKKAYLIKKEILYKYRENETRR